MNNPVISEGEPLVPPNCDADCRASLSELVTLLSAYLERPSSDGRPIRQDMRRELSAKIIEIKSRFVL